MKKPENKPEFLCMAPWVHTYLSPQSERRLCCASREPAQNFKQYIDTDSGTGEYNPLTLEEWWNSEHVRNIRVTMMAGEIPDECQVCNHKLLNTDVYRSYFWHLFKHHYNNIWDHTEPDGYTYMKPVSWDYRFSNLCNYKCRMCGDMLSSSWESEERKHNMIDFGNPKNNWMKKDIRKQIEDFQINVVDKEFEKAVEEHRVEEIYWVGGEPLMMEEHWRYMKRIIELGDGGKVYARYNTNLSRITYKETNLFVDILPNIRDFQLCCSIDGTGAIGEYIRTGLKWDEFLEYFKQGMAISKHPRQMRLDFTLTLPGLFELKNMFDLSKQLNTTILSKVTFSFTPDIMMSPLMLPKHILHRIIKEFIDYANDQGHDQNQQPLIDVMNNLWGRPTFEEQWPEEYKDGQIKGKKRVLSIEAIRPGLTLEEILQQNDGEAYEWYKNIVT
jgi:hypothetical protein